MIFGHGPSGFFMTWLLRILPENMKWNNVKTKYILLLGTVGAMAPDLDLFYTYLVDAGVSHREFITHTPFFWLLASLIVFILLTITRKQQYIPYALTFTLGGVLHVVFDTITAQIRLLYPFSRDFMGVADFGILFINENLLYINFVVEATWFALAGYAAIVLFSKSKKQRLQWTAILAVVFMLILFGLHYANQHVHHENLAEYPTDLDSDGLMNYIDTDIDGDGILNIDDLDPDADNMHTVEEIIRHSEDFFGVWHDPTDGGLIHIPIRLGLINNEDVIMRLYNDSGIFIKTEMMWDYVANPEGYVIPPEDKNFARHPDNIANWLKHINRYENATDTHFDLKDTRIGDILFFENGYVTVMTGVSSTGKPQYLDIQHGRESQELTLPEIIELEGTIIGRGVLLDQTPLFAE